MNWYYPHKLVLSTQIKLSTHNNKSFKSPLIQEKLRFLVNLIPKTQLDRLIGFISNYEKIINSHALYIFLKHIKIWEVY